MILEQLIYPNMDKNRAQVVNILKSGGLAIFPTDTAVGVGCRIDSPLAVEEIFKIKGRPKDKPMLILASGLEMAQEYAEFSEKALEFAKQNWPAGITLILLAKKNMVPEIVRAGGDTVAVRVPAYGVIRGIIEEIGVPIVAPSANFSGEKTPYTLEEVDKNILDQVKIVLKGECYYKKESTLIDSTVTPWKVVRQGAVEVDLS